MMGALNSIIIELHLSFADNGSDQTSSADMFNGISEKIKRHIACRPLWVRKSRREVLLMES